ncbi:MAG: CDP-alcohol phosphatidyltransferase family protein [Planctomycetes bacterium]|nr:CDP-alcohol phosphatidyltransferase family protein [Planctomycetota bacterium]
MTMNRIRSSTRRTFRRVHILPSLLTVGNFSCGFISIVLCLNALFFSTRAQILEEQPSAGDSAVVQAAPLDPTLGAEERKARRNTLALETVPGARARAGFLFHWACIVIFFGMVFDMLDGKIARAMGASTPFGTELDSLADVTTFGIAPAIIVNTISLAAMPASYAWWSQVITFGLIFAICAVLRLARYNIESGTADKNIFSGLPSPAAAGCVVSAVLIAQGDYAWVDAAASWLVGLPFLGDETGQVKARLLAVFLLVPGLLMVSTVPFVHVSNRYLSGKKSFTILVLAVLLLVLVWHEPRFMLFVCFNGYMLAGLVLWVRKRLWGAKPPADGAPLTRTASAPGIYVASSGGPSGTAGSDVAGGSGLAGAATPSGPTAPSGQASVTDVPGSTGESKSSRTASASGANGTGEER